MGELLYNSSMESLTELNRYLLAAISCFQKNPNIHIFCESLRVYLRRFEKHQNDVLQALESTMIDDFVDFEKEEENEVIEDFIKEHVVKPLVFVNTLLRNMIFNFDVSKHVSDIGYFKCLVDTAENFISEDGTRHWICCNDKIQFYKLFSLSYNMLERVSTKVHVTDFDISFKKYFDAMPRAYMAPQCNCRRCVDRRDKQLSGIIPVVASSSATSSC